MTVLAGQAYDFASEYAAAELARRAAVEGLEPPRPPYRSWLDRLAEYDPHGVWFAHDTATWASKFSPSGV
ncbi:hypothetical protein ABT354_12370 [Streptomyces sp. NPDC000594]|uniref:hypothetical protein n=1 Tax=Streptomyces sp. NPDC000594 TaxID=3154261 RepID=UPI0033180B61